MNGDDMELVETPVCVPPKAVTAHCLMLAAGDVSTVIVYVGEVNPVCVEPVTGDERDIAIGDNSRVNGR